MIWFFSLAMWLACKSLYSLVAIKAVENSIYIWGGHKILWMTEGCIQMKIGISWSSMQNKEGMKLLERPDPGLRPGYPGPT